MSLLYFVIINKKRSNYTRKVDNLILLTSFLDVSRTFFKNIFRKMNIKLVIEANY